MRWAESQGRTGEKIEQEKALGLKGGVGYAPVNNVVRDLRRHAFMMRRSKRLASPMPENFTPGREVGRAAANACCRQRGPAASVRRLTGAPCFWAIIDW